MPGVGDGGAASPPRDYSGAITSLTAPARAMRVNSADATASDASVPAARLRGGSRTVYMAGETSRVTGRTGRGAEAASPSAGTLSTRAISRPLTPSSTLGTRCE